MRQNDFSHFHLSTTLVLVRVQGHLEGSASDLTLEMLQIGEVENCFHHKIFIHFQAAAAAAAVFALCERPNHGTAMAEIESQTI